MGINQIKKTLSRFLIYKILRDLKGYLSCIIIYDHVFFLKDVLTTISQHFYERKLGIYTTTGGLTDCKDESVHKDMVPYIPTPYRELRKIVAMLPLNAHDVFVDIGCGQGRVVCYVASQNLKQVIGIELSSELVELAERNRLTCKRLKTPVEIIQCDASAWVPTHGTIFFMFHPFGLKTLRKVIANIEMSYRQNPRTIRLVYYGPMFKDILDEETWLERETAMSIGDVVITWRNRPTA